MKSVTLQLIGVVENKNEIGGNLNWQNLESKIIVDDKFTKGLDGIEEYSHIMLIFWMDRVKYDENLLKVSVPYAPKDTEKKGIFATRIPMRPNPIGVSVVQLISRNKNILKVRGLDALNKTPILDIKPYTGHPRDIINDFKVPKWEQR